MSRRGWLTAGAAAVAGVDLLPTVAAIGPLRTRIMRGLSGYVASQHVAITFDDGPDPISTPLILDELARRGVSATFFVLGGRVREHPQVVRRIAAAGHELAVHGWSHRCHLARGPRDLATDLRTTCEQVSRLVGCTPRYWRPPYGIPTGAGLLAARQLRLTPVLWTAWGRDWTRDANPDSVRRTAMSSLDAGGTLLLHDADTTSAPGSWRATLGALPAILDECEARAWRVGTVAEHYRRGR